MALNEMTNDVTMTSRDPEPPMGTIVRDARGRRWHRFDDETNAWIQLDDDDDVESWIRVAGNYGPVTVVGFDL